MQLFKKQTTPSQCNHCSLPVNFLSTKIWILAIKKMFMSIQHNNIMVLKCHGNGLGINVTIINKKY